MAFDAGFKRPRTDGFGGFPGDGMMGAQGQFGGMGDGFGIAGAAGSMFPCIKLRGLPFDVGHDDVGMFLGMEPIDVVLVKRDGRLTGEAFVVVAGPMQVELAMGKNRSYMGRRYIEIYKAKKVDYYRAVAQDLAEGGPTFGNAAGIGIAAGMPAARFRADGAPEDRFNGGMPTGMPGQVANVMQRGMQGMGGMPVGNAMAAAQVSVAAYSGVMGAMAAGFDASATGGTTILKLRGLPFSVGDDDICQWFNEDKALGISPVVKDNVLVVMDHGRPSGVAFVEFVSPQEATAAMAKNKQMMGSRYVEIFPATRADLDRCR